MATVTLRDEDRVLEDDKDIREFLGRFGIWYRRFDSIASLPPSASDDEVLETFREPIDRLKQEGGYTTADVIQVNPDTPGLQAMLDKFNKEHWHDEDEVRFIIDGRGLFHVHPEEGPVFSIEVVRGDMINVPRGTHHWFDLCEDRNIRAVRLFQDTSGWTPHYTDSGEDEKHQPLCFGPSYPMISGSSL